MFKTCFKLTDIIRQKVSRKAFGSVALGRVVVSITAEDQNRAAQQRRRVEVPGGAALCQYPPARARKREKMRVTQSCETPKRSSVVTQPVVRHLQTNCSIAASALVNTNKDIAGGVSQLCRTS